MYSRVPLLSACLNSFSSPPRAGQQQELSRYRRPQLSEVTQQQLLGEESLADVQKWGGSKLTRHRAVAAVSELSSCLCLLVGRQHQAALCSFAACSELPHPCPRSRCALGFFSCISARLIIPCAEARVPVLLFLS